MTNSLNLKTNPVTISFVWGARQLPKNSEIIDIINHPTDNQIGLRLRLKSGRLVHAAAGVIRTLPLQKLK